MSLPRSGTRSMVVRTLPTERLSGPLQMGLDDALLVAASKGQATFRFYEWSQPTLSLGYFQHAADRQNDPHLDGVAFVRRPSGGGAILHHLELTYTLALPAGQSWQPAGRSWACRFHGILIQALAEFGVHARAVACGEERKLGPFLCFEHQTAGDLLLGEHKIVGSAQRRLHGATMQHGSILLEQSPHTPSLPGIAECAGIRIAPRELEAVISRQLLADTGWEFQPGEWADWEHPHAQEQIAARFENPDWNEKR
ncbi:lipoate--protein ligase family protein [Tuwongella immobilis]|uniref:BPL/LPL catalytic domain-containing protein n=1 Tax=Tuwongella immobilis TaxID=692036 RepID=A0A6C2YLW8_9BACT|nr:lipoate--protein ligase family protein [Tuwongella immobilis]VIP02357.1 biotin lipoate a b protein ligase : Biotin/lipoate A/B protein ligase OS=Pirellula staleyi (strain ATCC 27377 / DSM 6068 / ICPB 4128) GN=Psta_4669 PE=4 SV=1: BPL_LplA_LipB [Tuwongella immobilis]VTS01157.1 biotin lipoate a b protein ligase : Biotin/lipoate A/B protein ligase OS=Pirellula staleyi (strain ATCC 27377 / DSM 6068 / ICPB 4128) GN=Psta_4669 PE=4 SV=1: BPL_LplA_LipB [Tuwongella immobilis]